LEKSKSEFAKKTLKETSHLSPLSMAIAFEQIKRGKDLDLKQVFEMEYKIS
jgi:enoyl-CoA hydratase/carnithine racemase